MRKYLTLTLALALALAVGVTSLAMASGNTLNTQKMKVTLKPSTGLSKTKYKPGKLRSLTTTGTTGSGTYAITPVNSATIFYDKNIRFDTKGLKTCKNTPAFQATDTNGAKAACGNAIVGKGAAKVQLAGDPSPGNTVSANITAFNGVPAGGKPVILLHTYVPSLGSTTVLVGTLSHISGPFGYKLNVVVPPLPLGTATTIFDVTVNHAAVKVHGVKHTYINERCPGSKWKFKGTFHYKSTSGPSKSGSLNTTASEACKGK